MAIITDYGTLRSEIQVWAARTDSVFSNRIPVFIEATEARLYDGAGEPDTELYTPPLRSRAMEVTETLVSTDGVAALPAEALEVRRLYREGDDYGITFVPPERFRVDLANNPTGDNPLRYTIENGQILTVAPYTGNLSVNYFRSYDAITASNTTGPLLSAHGALYLSGCLFEAFTFLQDGALAGAHLSRLRSLIAGANRSASAMRMPGPLRIRVRNHIP